MFTFLFIVFFFGIWLMNRIYLGVQPGKNMVEADLTKIRKESQPDLDSLVKWNNEELELLSYNVERKIKKKGFGKYEAGFFKSIYQERMFYYAIKEYMATAKKIVLYARTKDHEIIYQINKNGAQVYVDSEHLGIISTNGEFVNSKSRKFFGSIKRQNKQLTKIYNEQDELLGSIKVPESWEGAINPRASDMEKELDEKDLLLFKIMSIYEILLIYIEKNK